MKAGGSKVTVVAHRLSLMAYIHQSWYLSRARHLNLSLRQPSSIATLRQVNRAPAVPPLWPVAPHKSRFRFVGSTLRSSKSAVEIRTTNGTVGLIMALVNTETFYNARFVVEAFVTR
jgi:hypothetical protein